MDSALFIGSIGLIVIGLILYIIESANVIKVSDLQIPTDRFVSLVFKWCEANIGNSPKHYKIKVFQSVDKKMAGQYICERNQIDIYFFEELPLIELVDSCIHEYTHHLQFSDTDTESEYYKWDKGFVIG